MSTPALGHFGHQDYLPQSDRQGTNPPFATPSPPRTPLSTLWTLEQLLLDSQIELHPAPHIFGLLILVALTDPKGMINQTLAHASVFTRSIQLFTLNFPEEPVIPMESLEPLQPL
jgi:hypothetical protein